MTKPGDFDIYCEKILTGEINVDVLYESDRVLAYDRHNNNPAYETHYMIIPKEHIHDLEALSKKHGKLIQEMILVASDLSKKLDKEGKGVRLITNLGKFQDTPHLHFHLEKNTDAHS